jgi:hypothetical protein
MGKFICFKNKKEAFTMGKIILNVIRQRQEQKKTEPVLVSGEIIDLVDHAIIERNYAEYLRLMIEETPQVLGTQFKQYLGKSRSHGDMVVRDLINQRLVGTKTFRGLQYLYPLSKSLSWYHREKSVKTTRTDYSDKYLFEQFMKAEFIIRYAENGKGLTFINDIKDYLKTVKFPEGISLYLKEENYPEKIVKLSELNEKQYENFLKNAFKELDKNLKFMTVAGNKNGFGVKVYLVHNENMAAKQYYSYLKCLYMFIRLFVVEHRVINIVVLTEKEFDVVYVEKYLEQAKVSVNREFAISGATSILTIVTDVINLDIARYYQRDLLDYEVLSDSEKEDLDNVKIPE